MCRCVCVCVSLYTNAVPMEGGRRGLDLLKLELQVAMGAEKDVCMLSTEWSHQPRCSFKLNKLCVEPRSRRARV